jgi:hypothetical protein
LRINGVGGHDIGAAAGVIAFLQFDRATAPTGPPIRNNADSRDTINDIDACVRTLSRPATEASGMEETTHRFHNGLLEPSDLVPCALDRQNKPQEN